MNLVKSETMPKLERHCRRKENSVIKLIVRNKRNIAVSAVFFFISLAKWFEFPAVYVLCCMAAWAASRERPLAPVAGILSGFLFQQLWHIEIPVWHWLCIFVMPIFSQLRRRSPRIITLFVILLLLPGEILRLLMQTASTRDILLSCLSLMIGGMSVPALMKANRLTQPPFPNTIGVDDLFCIMIPFMMMLCGMSKVNIGPFNIGYSFSVFFVLLNAMILPWETAVFAGAVSGISLLLGGEGTFWCALFSLGAFMSSALQGKKRIWSVLTFSLICLLLGYLLSGKILWQALYACAGGGAAFLIFSEKAVQKYSAWTQKCTVLQKSDNPYLQRKLKKWVDIMQSLSQAVPEPRFTEENTLEMSEDLAERTCDGCPQMMFCWQDHFDERKKEFIQMCDTVEHQKIAEVNCELCIQKEKLSSVLNTMLDKKHMMEHRKKQADYEQSMLITHFQAISQAMMRLAKEGEEPAEGGVYMEKQIEEVLTFLKYPGKVRYVKKINNHYAVGLYCSPFLQEEAQEKQLRHYISLKLEANMKIAEKKDGYVILEEVPPLKVTRGIASACAVSPHRDRNVPYEVQSGDATIFQTLCGGFELSALSDGMGHGKKAGEESTKTLELLTLCLEAGYTRIQAMNAVNGMMLSSTGGERFATVDLCIVNLWTGETCLNKLGACMSLTVQGQHIRTIEGAALPLGIIEHVIPMEHTLKLGKGDMLLLISDGIADAFEHAQCIADILRGMTSSDPQQIANALLQEAIYKSAGLPEDDMTVVCLKIEENKKGD